MRIVHLLKHGHRGNGHVHVAVDLACSQADAGHEVAFVAGTNNYSAVLVSHGVQLVELPEATSLRTSVVSAAALGRVLARLRPDVVHAHMMSSAVLGYFWTRLLRTPMVTTVHNSFDRHSFLMRLGDRVVAVSQAERELLISRGYPKRKLSVILNGSIDSPRDVLAGTEDVHVPRPSIMNVSGLHPRKGVGDLIEAFSLVAERYPAWHLNIVGAGPSEDDLRASVSKLHLVDRVHFLGPVMSSRDVLLQTDIFATASLAEPGGLSVMEARGAGCAIVATRVGGIPETLDQGESGVLVPPADPPAFADALALMMEDPSKLADWRARALSGSNYFTARRMSDDYLTLYRWVSGA